MTSSVSERREGVIVEGPLNGPFTYFVFTETSEPLIKVPSHLFDANGYSVFRNASGKERVCQFLRGDNVTLYVTLDTDSVTKMEKRGGPKEIQFINGKLVAKTLAIVSPDTPRRCWTSRFGIVPVNEKVAQQALPNVPLKAYIAFCVDEASIDNPDGPANYTLIFDSFLRVAPDEDHYVPSAPWNAGDVRLAGALPEDEMELLNPYERMLEARKNDKNPPSEIHASGFMLNEREIYSEQYGSFRIKVGLLRDHDAERLHAGICAAFRAYFCRYNSCYIACEVSTTGSAIPSIPGHDGKKSRQPLLYKFHVRIRSTGLGGYYTADMIGYIVDLHNKLLGVDINKDMQVYVRRYAYNSLAKFEIVAVNAEVMPLTLFFPIVEALGFVIDVNGEVFSKKLANCTVLLREDLRSSFCLGQWICFRARFDGATRSYVIESAAPSERYAPLECAFVTEENAYALLLPGVQQFNKEFFFLYSEFVGIVQAYGTEFVDFYYFFGSRPFDLWVVPNEDPRAQYRLRAYSVIAPLPRNLEVLASGELKPAMGESGDRVGQREEATAYGAPPRHLVLLGNEGAAPHLPFPVQPSRSRFTEDRLYSVWAGSVYKKWKARRASTSAEPIADSDGWKRKWNRNPVPQQKNAQSESDTVALPRELIRPTSPQSTTSFSEASFLSNGHAHDEQPARVPAAGHVDAFLSQSPGPSANADSANAWDDGPKDFDEISWATQCSESEIARICESMPNDAAASGCSSHRPVKQPNDPDPPATSEEGPASRPTPPRRVCDTGLSILSRILDHELIRAILQQSGELHVYEEALRNARTPKNGGFGLQDQLPVNNASEGHFVVDPFEDDL